MILISAFLLCYSGFPNPEPNIHRIWNPENNKFRINPSHKPKPKIRNSPKKQTIVRYKTIRMNTGQRAELPNGWGKLQNIPDKNANRLLRNSTVQAGLSIPHAVAEALA
jgi:hypothetical protein